MKKRLTLIVALILVFVLALTGCELLSKKATKVDVVNLDEVLAEIGEIKVDSELDFSALMVRVSYSDGSFKMVSTADGLVIEKPDISKGGTVTVKYSFEGVAGTFNIQVIERNLTSIEVDSSSLKKDLIVGEIGEYDLSGLKVTAKYSDGASKLLSADEYEVSLPDFTTSGEKKITVSYGGQSAEITVRVKAPLAISVDSSSVPTSIEAGDEVDVSGIIVKLVYSDGTSKTLAASEYTTNFDSLDFATAGKKTVVVTYGSFTDDFDINVKAGVGITVDASALASVVMTKDELDLSLLVVTLKYTDNSTRALSASEYTTNIDEIDFATGGQKTVRVSFEDYSATFGFTVKKATAIVIDDSLVAKTVMAGTTPDLSSLVVSVKYNVGANLVLSADEYTTNLSELDFTVGGEKEIVVSALGFSQSFEIFVKQATGIALDAREVNTALTVEEELDYSALKVYLVYNDGSRELLESGYTAVEENRNDADARKLVVSYGDFTAELKVVEATLQSIEYAFTGAWERVPVGGTPTFSKFAVTAVYSNGSRFTLENSEVTFAVDTATYGQKDVVITYEGVSVTATGKVMVYEPRSLTPDTDGSVTTVKIDNVAALDISSMEVCLTYSDGVTKWLNPGEYTTNLSELDLTTAGEKTLVISAEGITENITITVIGIEKLEIVGVNDSYKDEAADLSDVTVKVTYVGGESRFINLADTTSNAAELDLATAGDKTLVVSYYGAEATKTFKVITLSSMTVTSGAPSRVVAGDTVVINGIVVTATYSDGSTKTYTLAGVTADGLDFSVAGTVALRYVVNGEDYYHNITVVAVSSVTIENAPSLVYHNDAIDLSGVVITVTYTDDETATIPLSDCTTEFDSSAVGKQTLTVTYRGVSKTVDVEVKAKVYITGVSFEPAVLSEAQKTTFNDMTPYYTVGDDNAFRIKLALKALDSTNKPVTVADYVGKTSVYLVENGGETLLNGNSLATYAVIDDNAHTVDFTDAAVGKTFRIVFGVVSSEATTALIVDVVDAFNIYDVKELNYITNGGEYTGADANGEAVTYSNLAAVDKFLASNKMVRPEKFNGIVLHGDMIITENDLPSDYLYTGDGKVEIYDYMDIYYRELEYGETFNMYGNFFTINSYYIPTVVARISDTVDYLNDNDVSSAQLFHLWGTKKVQDQYILPENYDYTTMVYNIKNIAFIDSRPNSNDGAEIDRSKLGLIGIKSCMNVTNMVNSQMQRYFIGYLADKDYHTTNFIDCNFFNSWQNHVFLFGDNEYASLRGEQQQAPKANQTPVTVNVIRSQLTKTGGPVIIAQHAYVDTDYRGQNENYKYRESNINSGPIVNIDGDSTVESFVAGTEAWFEAYPGSNMVAAMIKAMSKGFENMSAYGFNATFAPNNKAITGVEGVQMMNIKVLLMSDGFDVNALMDLNAVPKDIDGLVTIGGVEMINLNDAHGVDNYANPMLVTYCNVIQQMTKAIPPVFKSSAGGWCFSDGDATIGSLSFDENGNPIGADSLDMNVLAGDDISLMYKGVGLLFGYYH